MAGALGVHRQAVQHARLPHAEVGDVDRFLDFAQALLVDLADFQRDERAERVLVLTQRIAQLAHDLTALGGRHFAPTQVRLVRGAHDGLVLLRGRLLDRAEDLACGRVAALQHRAGGLEPLPCVGARMFLADTECFEDVCHSRQLV